MRVTIKVKVGAKETYVKEIAPDTYVVSVTARPVDGEANKAIIKELAAFFDVAPTLLRIVSGKTSKTKIIEVE